MKASRYITRWGLMLGVVMPITAVGLTISSLFADQASGPADAFGGAFLLVYVWGALTGTAMSLLHSAIVNSPQTRGLLPSVVIGLVLGVIAGALTPTMFTGLFDPVAVALGGLAGLLYGAFVEAVTPSRARRTAQVEDS